MSIPFTLIESVQDDHAFLTLTGSVDSEVGLSLRERIRHFLHVDDIRGVVLDLALAGPVDDFGLGILLDCRLKALTLGKTLRVNAVREEVERLWNATGVMRLLEGVAVRSFSELPTI